MHGSRKKVIVRKLSREWLAGYLAATNLIQEGQLELLHLNGKVAALPASEVKWVCYVRDFNSGEPDNPERLLRKTFAGRPRSEGLWLKMRLADGDLLEGLAANDVTLLAPEGIFLVPPDIRANTQRIFVPRSSISELEVAAVIPSPARRRSSVPPQQEDLFSSTP